MRSTQFGWILLLGVIVSGLVACKETPKEPAEAQEEESTSEQISSSSLRLDSFTQLLNASPSDPDLLNERAKAFLEVGELNLAIADVGRAILLDSTVADYYLTISDVYFRLSKPDRCLNALHKANDLQPENPEPLYRLAQFELYLQHHQKSINYANDMLRLDARDDRPYVIKGLCFKELKDTTRAIQNYLEAVSENPDNYDAYVELGVLHWGRKDPLAEQFFKSALDINPSGIDALYALGMFYQNADKLNDALETYTRILAIDSTFRSAHFNMGYIQYQYLQLYKEALVNFDNAVKIDPNYYQAIYMRGLCYEARGDVEKAKREYGHAIQVNPDYKKAADGLKRLLSKM
ncbi:MAG: tetratricopeptide repeat protein [Flavobacteriales bacterium]|nr:tetratricopeptide repeat protein [Flavobacteriales bacterium]